VASLRNWLGQAGIERAAVLVRGWRGCPGAWAAMAEPAAGAGERSPQEGSGVSVASEPEAWWLPKMIYSLVSEFARDRDSCHGVVSGSEACFSTVLPVET